MAVAEVIKQGKKPVFHFLCPLCGHEWNEYYLEGSAMITVETALQKNFEKQFQASMQCPCCGLVVLSYMRGRETGEEEFSTRCETCKNYESNSDITGWCSACPGTVTKGMNKNNTCAAYEKREEKE